MARSRDISKVLSSDTSVVLADELEKPFRNLIINGAMQVAQRATSVASITSSTANLYTADRWNMSLTSLGTWTQSVENDAPTDSGFRKSLKWLCTSADAAPAAGDFLVFSQRLEGQNLQTILKGTSSAKQLTLSFWVKSNVTGTYIVELVDSDNSRNVSASFSVSASAIWEKKTIIFPADTTGVLDNDNAESLRVQFWLGAGTTYTSGTLQTTWATPTNANRAVGQTNLASATNNYWQITGVQLEVGAIATPYEHKPFDVELTQCHRYFWRGFVAAGGGWGGSGGTVPLVCWPYPVKMRAAPIWAWISGGIAGNGNQGYNITGVVTSTIQADSAILGFSISGSTGSNTQGCYVYDSLNSFSAEL